MINMIDDEIDDTRSELAKRLMKPWADMSDRLRPKEFLFWFLGNKSVIGHNIALVLFSLYATVARLSTIM